MPDGNRARPPDARPKSENFVPARPMHCRARAGIGRAKFQARPLISNWEVREITFFYVFLNTQEYKIVRETVDLS